MKHDTICKVLALRKKAIQKINNAGFDVKIHETATNGHITIDAGLFQINYYPTTEKYHFHDIDLGDVKGFGLDAAIKIAIAGKHNFKKGNTYETRTNCKRQ